MKHEALFYLSSQELSLAASQPVSMTAFPACIACSQADMLVSGQARL